MPIAPPPATLEAESADHLRVLLGVLADAEARRLGLPEAPEHVAQTTRWVRGRHDLLRRRELDAFLDFAALSPDRFTAQMRTLSNIARVQAHHHDRIEARLPRYRAVFSAREWLMQREEG